MFEVGDKVFPIDKTVLGTLGSSISWSRAKDAGQDFLYVRKLTEYNGREIVVCTSDKSGLGGDYFNFEDLVSYPVQFQPGDIVKRRNGLVFSNEEYTATIDREYVEDRWWLKETKTQICAKSLELVRRPKHSEPKVVQASVHAAIAAPENVELVNSVSNEPKEKTKVSQSDIDHLMDNSQYYISHRIFGKQCIVVAKLPNGFTVVGEAACVDPNNYDEVTGEKLAKKKIESRLWELEGYSLQNSIGSVFV
jgi:hypothetical protein